MNPHTTLLLSVATTGRVFGLDLQTLIQVGINLFNAAVLAFVLAKILYNPVRNFLKKRADKIKLQLDTANSDMAKANELKIKYEQKLKDIEAEREKALDSARKLVAEKARLLLLEAKSEAATIKERAIHDIAMEKERFQVEMKQSVIEISVAMTEKLVVHTVDADIQDRIFAETMAEIEDATWQN